MMVASFNLLSLVLGSSLLSLLKEEETESRSGSGVFCEAIKKHWLAELAVKLEAIPTLPL